MYGFYGWVGWQARADERREVLDRMQRGLERVGVGVHASVSSDLASLGASGKPQTPPVQEQHGYWIVAQGDAVFARCIGFSQAKPQNLMIEILESYLERGEAVLHDLRGGFSLAIVSKRGDDALLAVDRIGGRFPLSYKTLDGSVVFSTSGDPLQSHPLGRSDLDFQSVYNYLYFHVTPSPRSIRRGVHQIPPAGFVRFHQGVVRTGTYWAPSFQDDARVAVPELCEEFRRLIREGVDANAQGADVGCFLSGGTDSSTIAGYLGRVTGAPARTYSIGFDAAGFDEMEYARTAARAFETNHKEYYVKPDDVVEIIPRIARAYPNPFANASAVPTYYCAKMGREDGIRRMLGGDGGDEIFAGNERYAVQKMLEFYTRIPRFARQVLEAGLTAFGTDIKFGPIRKVHSYVSQANAPMPHRLQNYNYFEREGADSIIDSDFLKLIDTREPAKLLAEVYNSVRSDSMLNRMLALDLKFTLADNDLPKVSQMCLMAGVDAAYPFLTDDLIEFSTRVPARLKLRGLTLRWFMKHALRDFLPREVLRKKKQGFGLPFGVWMKEHRRLNDFVHASLAQLQSRQLVRADYVDDLLRRHDTEHATYFGVMIWVLMMLEQWFQHHEDAEQG